jgi:hypothetical protein
MVETMRDVRFEAVEIQGGHYIGTRPGHVRFSGGPDSYHLGGGYVVAVGRYTTGTSVVELVKAGRDEPVAMVGFDTILEGELEFRRIKAQLELLDRVKAVMDLLYVTTGVLPVEFLPSVLAGDLGSLVIAADFQDEQDKPDAAMLLRAAYYRLTGRANVVVKPTRKTTLVLNPQVVTKRSPEGRNSTNLGELAAVLVTPGEGVRIVSLDTNKYTPVAVLVKEFKVGDQAEYDSYNLVYYAPIESITAKTVVVAGYRPDTQKHRLTIAKFVEKNRDFDLAKARRRNDEWSD